MYVLRSLSVPSVTLTVNVNVFDTVRVEASQSKKLQADESQSGSLPAPGAGIGSKYPLNNPVEVNFVPGGIVPLCISQYNVAPGVDSTAANCCEYSIPSINTPRFEFLGGVLIIGG